MRFFILALCLCLSAHFSYGELAVSPLKEKARSAVWKISSTETGNGTAVFITPHLALTNFHVLFHAIKDLRLKHLKDSVSIKNISLVQEGSSRVLHLNRVERLSASWDLALISTTEPAPDYLSLRDRKIEDPKEALRIIGYPKGHFKEIQKRGDIFFGSDTLLFAVNRSLLKGASGSPLIDAKGDIAGLLYGGYFSNIAVFRPVSHLHSFIEGEWGRDCSGKSEKTCIEEEIKNLNEFARAGEATAQIELAYIYSRFKDKTMRNILLSDDCPPNIHQIECINNRRDRDLTDSFLWYRRAAKQGYASAQYELAWMYLEISDFGGIEPASFWFKKAAEQGHVPSQYKLALLFMENSDIVSAFFWMKRAAEQGYAVAQYKLAQMLIKGEGVDQDLEKAAFWYEKAAEIDWSGTHFGLTFPTWRSLLAENQMKAE